MKRLFSFMMALVLVLSLGTTAFADENTGSITITNATIGKKYAPYKIFDATISGGEDGGFIYSIKKDNQFFDELFGNFTNPSDNTYFTFVSNGVDGGTVTKKEGADDNALLEYLKLLVYDKVENGTDENGHTVYKYVLREGLTPAKAPVEANSDTVLIDALDYGYYLVTSTLGTMVTIDSTHPNVSVIDKNQKPGENFGKLVWDEDYTGPNPDIREDENGDKHTGKWVVNSSADIGEMVHFQVEFDATNYNGDKQIKYYTVGDKKGDALWVEFNTITVEVDGVPLERGYYHGIEGTQNTGEWKYFGTWTDEEKLDPDHAQWFMVHRGFDDYDIIIPWMDNYHFEGTATDFKLTFDKIKDNPAESIYGSSVKVVIKYSASVEPNANIDGESNLYNKADLSWTDETTWDSPEVPKTDLSIFAIGVTKTDGNTGTLLSDAVFEIYNDYNEDTKVYSNPVYVIPTDAPGLYIVDDLKTNVSGMYRESARKLYQKYLKAYLGENYEILKTQKYEVKTVSNGKLAILGLEKGTYYLKEIVAPGGYNELTTPVTIVVDETKSVTPYSFVGKNDKDEDVTRTYKVISAGAKNYKGAQLPSTGGEGAMKMITIGTMVAMVFAVLLITHKKMSIYHD